MSLVAPLLEHGVKLMREYLRLNKHVERWSWPTIVFDGISN